MYFVIEKKDINDNLTKEKILTDMFVDETKSIDNKCIGKISFTDFYRWRRT